MDLGTVDKTYTPDEPEFLHLNGYDGTPDYDKSGNPVGFFAVGAESDVAKKHYQKRINKARKEINGKRRKKKNEDEDLDLDDLVKDEAEDLSAILTGWSGFWLNEKDGVELDFNYENIILILTHPKLTHYRKQLRDFTKNPLNWTKD